MVYNNSSDINPIGLVKANGSGVFSGETTTQYNVLSGAASNGINNIAPGTAGYVLTSNGPSAQPTFQAASGGSITIAGDSGSITGTSLTIYSNLAANGSGSTVLFSNSSTTSTLKVSDASANTLIGNNAGNASVSGIHNTSLGVNTLAALTSGQKNTVLGWNCGTAITDGYANVIIGDNSGTALTSGQYNIIIGHETAPSFAGSGGFPNGSLNVILGVSSGYNYTSTESNCILLGSGIFGVANENDVMRLGNNGPYQFTAETYIAGIDGNTVTGPLINVDASTDQLGVISYGNAGEALISGGAGVSPSFGVLGPAGGGLGITTVPTNGQIPIGNGTNYTAATLSAGSNISITNAAGSITIAASTGAITYTDQATNFTAVSNNGYFVTGTATATLPASPAQGDTISFVVDTANVLTITANIGQKIRVGSAISATAGTCSSNAIGSSIELVYRTSGATWFANSSPQGTWTLI